MEYSAPKSTVSIHPALVLVSLPAGAAIAGIIGLDINTQASNHAAVLHSRDTDEAAVSAPFRLDQSSAGDVPDGVTLRLPVYSPGKPPVDVEERRRRLRGSVSAAPPRSWRAVSRRPGAGPRPRRAGAGRVGSTLPAN